MSEDQDIAERPTGDSEKSGKTLLEPRSFAAVLGVLVLASYWEVLFSNQTLFQRDFLFFGYPLAHYHKSMMLAGEMPLWNPLSHCGIPFLAQWNTMVLYPGASIYLLFPLPWSLNLFVILHAYAAGLGMYFLARHLTKSDAGGAVAGVAYCFCGLLQESLLWPNNMAAFGWLPWVVLTIDRGVRAGRRRLVTAALCGGIQMLTGAPEVILFTWILAAALVLLVSPDGRFEFCGTRLRRFFGIGIWVAALAAVQLFPFLDLLGYASRTAGDATVHWAASSRVWVNLFVPAFDTIKESYGAYHQSAQGWTRSVYPGLAALLVGAAAIGRQADARVWLLLVAGIFVVGLSPGESGILYPAVEKLFPIGVMRYPVKFLILLGPAIPILAAFGMRAVCADNARRSLRPLLFVTFVTLFAYVVAMKVDRQVVMIRMSLVRQGVLWGLLAALICWMLLRRRSFTGALAGAFLFLQWIDLRWHLPAMVQSVDREAFRLTIPEDRKIAAPLATDFHRVGFSHLARNTLAFRHWPEPAEDVVMRRLHLAENLNLPDGVAKAGGFFSLWFFPQEEFMARVYSNDDQIRAAMADFLGIRYWKSMRGGLLWNHRPTAMPLVTAGQQIVFDDGHSLLDRMMSGSIDPRRTVFLPTAARGTVSTEPVPEARVANLKVEPLEITFDVESPLESAVVIAQCHYHRWQALVNGRPVKIHRANHAFQAIMVPPGETRVRLVYADRPFWFGLLVTASALAMAVIVWRRLGAEPAEAAQ